jgi:polyisoprenoid-binding protein YceI
LDTVKEIETGAFEIKQNASSVTWKGERITGEFHTGTVDIKSGNIRTTEAGIIGGEMVLDMTSMKELKPESEETTIVVMGYLQSERFFNTDKYPNAVLTIKGEKENKLLCDLTIRNVKKEILVPFTKTLNNDTIKANANFKIDRTDWGIDYRSAKNYKDLGMMAIKDSIGFKTAILAVKKTN